MHKLVLIRTCLLVLSLFSVVGWSTAVASETSAQTADVKGEFLKLCDTGYPIVEKQARTEKRIGRALYWHSYVVPALCVAYNMTGTGHYLKLDEGLKPR